MRHSLLTIRAASEEHFGCEVRVKVIDGGWYRAQDCRDHTDEYVLLLAVSVRKQQGESD